MTEIEPIKEGEDRTLIEERTELTEALSHHLLAIEHIIRKDLKAVSPIPYAELKELESVLQKWVYYSYYQMGKKDD